MADRPMGCRVIQDPLPLYVDGAAGRSPGPWWRRHLRSCPRLPPGAGAAAGAGGPFRRETDGGRSGLGGHPTPAGAAGDGRSRRGGAAAIAAMLAASQFVRFGIPGWQLAERDRERRGSRWCCQRRGTGTWPFFLYQEGSSLRYTYYENEPGLDFGYHFRASGTGHEETGGVCGAARGDTAGGFAEPSGGGGGGSR